MVLVSRLLETRVRDTLDRFPAVGLLGARQVGKTTLAYEIGREVSGGAVYLDLELASDRAKLADPELYLARFEDKLVVLDEIQRYPDIFQTLRGIIDRRKRQGVRSRQFLLLGSASMELLKQSAESLAGRIAYLELSPFTVPEIESRGATAADRLWVRGGFPDSFLARNGEDSMEWRQAFIQTYLERDIPTFGPRIPSVTLERFWKMLAHNQGQLLNAARLAASLGVSGQTVARYLDILVDLLLVRRLQPWTRNAGKRLIRSPKTYVRDSGLLHTLLGIGEMEDLLGHPVVGTSWEGFILENIIATAAPGLSAWFYRTSAGAEIDILLELQKGELWAIKVKRSTSAPYPSKGFHLACDDVKPQRRIVVYPGQESYKIESKVEVMPLGGLISLLA
jgi:uncharacterized protein